MRDLAVAILGTEDTTYNNASDCLDDYFPEDTIVYLPSYISSDQTGLRVTFDWLKDADIEYERVRKSQLFQKLLDTTAARHEVIILGVENNEDIITSSLNQSFPVMDLTRGLFRVTEADIALGGSDSQSESLSSAPGITTGVDKDLGLESVTAPQGDYLPDTPLADVVRDLVKRVSDLEKRMTSERAHVAVGESGWEPRPIDSEPKNGDLMMVVEGENVLVNPELTKYYKSARGKLRKAGKSKARPGETEVWLTLEEAEEN